MNALPKRDVAFKVTPLNALQPDVEEARRFIGHMLGCPDTPITFQTFDDDKGRRRPDLARILHGTVDRHAAQLNRLQGDRAGVFWLVNEGDGKGRQTHNVTAVRYLFADTDGAPLKPLVDALQPHAVIESSPGNWHVYYRVEDCPLDQFEALQRGIARRYMTDKSVTDLPRVMRVPGFHHMKVADQPHMVRIFELNDRPPYTLEEIRIDLIGDDMPAASPSAASAAVDGEALAHLGPDYLPDTPLNRSRLASALDTLSADVDYHEWMRIVFAIKATGWTDADDIARKWSEGAPDRFDDRSFDETVHSFREERRRGGDLIGPGTLFYLAKQAGWADPGKTAKGDTGRRFEAIPAHEFAKAVHVSWLVRDLLQRDGLGVIFGEAGSGKSFFVLDLSKAVAGGNVWCGLTVTPGRVVYVAAEGASGFRKRLQALAVDQGIPLEGLPLAVIADAPSFLTDDDKAVAEAVQSSGGAVLIVVDTLASVTPGGNENSAEDMGEVIARCKRLQSETGAFVLLVHHSGKDAARGARGWSGLRAAVDVEIEVTRIGDDRLAKVTKQKDSEDGGQFPFRLKTVHLGPDMEGNQSTSCVVEHLDDMPVVAGDVGKPRRPKGKNQRIVFEVIEKFAPCSVDDVLATGAKHMIQDPEKKIDKRRDYARQALESLIAGQFVKQGFDGLIRLYGDTVSDWDTEESDAVNAFEGDFA